MPVNDREVYAYFSSRSDSSPEVVALAYAGFAKAKYDWVAHIEKRGGAAMLCIEMDGPLSPAALAFLGSWPEMDWVRMVRPIMDAGATIGGGEVPTFAGTTA